MNPFFWQEDDPPTRAISNDVLDLVLSINCRSLPVDHAWALSTAIAAVLPWWMNEPLAGLHLIHGGDSGNGWQRPEAGNDLIYLTRRTRLILRLPRTRLLEARAALAGQTLDIAGYSLEIGAASERPLYPHSALYARHVIAPQPAEEDFLAAVAAELQAMPLRFKKLLPGKNTTLLTPDGECQTRSLLVADLAPEDSLELQRRGLGTQQKLGCGVFIPHKTIADHR